MLELENITVRVEERIVLENISFRIRRGEVLALFGPNGSGKSSLIKALMGISGYILEKGRAYVENELINNLKIEERAQRGLGIMFQHPASIPEVKLQQLAERLNSSASEIKKGIERLNLGYLKERSLNVDFSGGEMKRAELFQLLMQKPKVLLLDEPASGVDIENIALMSKVLAGFIEKQRPATLIITHTGYILNYIKAQRACVMLGGRICCFDRPEKILSDITKYGYEKCKDCRCRVSTLSTRRVDKKGGVE